MLIQFTNPPPEGTESHTQISPEQPPHAITHDFEENFPHQEGILSEVYLKPG